MRTYKVRIGRIEGDHTLAEVREAEQLSQRDVARAMRSHQSVVSRIERARNIRIATLTRYVNALGGELVLSFVDKDGKKSEIFCG